MSLLAHDIKIPSMHCYRRSHTQCSHINDGHWLFSDGEALQKKIPAIILLIFCWVFFLVTFKTV